MKDDEPEKKTKQKYKPNITPTMERKLNNFFPPAPPPSPRFLICLLGKFWRGSGGRRRRVAQNPPLVGRMVARGGISWRRWEDPGGGGPLAWAVGREGSKYREGMGIVLPSL